MKMKQPRVWWAGEEKGWIIDTEVALTNSEVLRSVEYTARVQKDRYRTLMVGPMKDECLATINALAAMRVTQNIVGTGDKVLFDSYKSEGKKVFA
jgi:hypothetical protein